MIYSFEYILLFQTVCISFIVLMCLDLDFIVFSFLPQTMAALNNLLHWNFLSLEVLKKKTTLEVLGMLKYLVKWNLVKSQNSVWLT